MLGRVRGVMATLAGASVLAASLVAGVAPVASAAGCSVTNAATGVRFTSLQSAVNAAAPGVTLKVAGSCKGNVTVGKRLTLLGTGTAPTLRGNGGRPLTVTAGPVTVDRLRITGGVASGCFSAPAGVACGGGIASSARLIVKRSLIDGNLVNGVDVAQGGGISVATGGSLKVTDSTIADNTLIATGETGLAQGGGIAVFGSATLTGSVIDGNVASGHNVNGGGIHSEPDGDAALSLTASEVTGNTALAESTAQGGGIMALGVLRLTRSTVAGNTASGTSTIVSNANGGGIVAGSAAIANSTISGNTATAAGLAVGGSSGGGLFLSDGSVIASTIAGNSAVSAGGALLGGSVEVGSTIIAGNTGSASGPDCQSFGGASSLGRNLIGNALGCGATFDNGVKGDKVGNDNVGASVPPIAPKLAALANNGGPTRTRALKPGSPAIDGAGGTPCSTITDQRGVARPKGAKCDIGAFEKS